MSASCLSDAKAERKCPDKGQPWEGMDHSSPDRGSRICHTSELKSSWGREGRCQWMMECLLLCDEMDGKFDSQKILEMRAALQMGMQQNFYEKSD